MHSSKVGTRIRALTTELPFLSLLHKLCFKGQKQL